MAGAKKIFLLQERRETLRLRISKTHRSGICPRCKREVEWLTASEAARFSGLSERQVFRLVEGERVHFLEFESESLLICRPSLETLRANTGKGRKIPT